MTLAAIGNKLRLPCSSFFICTFDLGPQVLLSPSMNFMAFDNDLPVIQSSESALRHHLAACMINYGSAVWRRCLLWIMRLALFRYLIVVSIYWSYHTTIFSHFLTDTIKAFRLICCLLLAKIHVRPTGISPIISLRPFGYLYAEA